MASCPKCFSNIEISSQFFGGLFTCPQCQAVYFISFDGVPEGVTENANTSENVMVEPPLQSPEFDTPVQPMTAEENLQNVIQYANSDVSSSPLTFQVTIEGLDILQNINELKEVFSDTKLQMNFQELRKKIKNGQLLIESIPPAKAAILVQRLRSLDLKMHWEQKVYE